MDNRKVTAIYTIHNNKIDSLRGFLSNAKQMYDYQKINLSESDFLDWLKLICYQIEEDIVCTIDYYQHNKVGEIEYKKALNKCKDFSILLHKYKLELFNSGFTESEYLEFKKERQDAFDFDLEPKKKRELLPNYLEIKKEFEDFIKVETSVNELPQQIINSEIFNDFIFKNNFDKVKENTIIEYFKTNLVEKKHISETVLNDFIGLAFDKKALPLQKFSFDKLNTQNDIVKIFYNYYKTIAGKPYGKQKEYLNLLCNYFNGFDNFNIKNFSK